MRRHCEFMEHAHVDVLKIIYNLAFYDVNTLSYGKNWPLKFQPADAHLMSGTNKNHAQEFDDER